MECKSGRSRKVKSDMANPQFPIFIPSKSRWEQRLTQRALEDLKVPYYVVVEPQEAEQYRAVTDERYGTVLVLPFSNLGLGAVPARNWIKKYSIEALKVEKHWQIDDDMACFYRLHNNLKIRVADGTIFRVAEDFCDRFSNVALAGFHYDFFAKRKQKLPPFYLNLRVYSTTLVNNAIPYEWRGRYNDDTDMNLRCLKAGWCTINFVTFLAGTVTTMAISGGMTDLYKKSENIKEDGRFKMAQALVDAHPDVTTITWRFQHWQHLVDYSRFKRNELRMRKDAVIPEQDPYDWKVVTLP